MAKINTLAIDIESFSSVDLAKSGVYRYAESPDFRILLFGYAVDYGDVNVIDLALGEEIPSEIIEAIRDENVIKWAHNASFERVCLSRYLRLPPHAYLPPESWRCSMVWSAYLGLPLSLKDVGRVLRLEEQKIDEGRKLIRLFCSPTVPSAKNGYFQRNLPEFFQEEPFYLTHKYDARGRVYCQGYHLSYQSDDFTNALIEFAEGEKVI